MSEPTPMSDEDRVEHETETAETGPNKKAPTPAEIPEPTWQHKTLDPDLLIDLSEEGAVEKLDQAVPLSPRSEIGETETPGPEDEVELESAMREHDEMRREFLDDMGPRYQAQLETENAALEMEELAKAGYGADELQRIANSIADAIMKNNAGSKDLGTKEAIVAYLRERYEKHVDAASVEDREDDDLTKNA